MDEKELLAKDAAIPLDDGTLEQVSGGSRSETKLYYCVYCDKRHVLSMYAPWAIKPAGSPMKYTGTKYVCSTRGSFYTVQMNNGSTAYFDAYLNQIQ